MHRGCAEADRACRALCVGSKLLHDALKLAEDRDKTRSKGDALSALAQLHYAFIRYAHCSLYASCQPVCGIVHA